MIQAFNKYKFQNIGSTGGSITVEFVIIIPLVFTLFLFTMELSKYWSEKYLFRVDVYYLSRSLTMGDSRINTSSSSNDSGTSTQEDSSYNTETNSNKVSNLIHKDKYFDICSRTSKYTFNFNVECKYENKTIFIKAHKPYKVKFFISRALLNVASLLRSTPILDMYEYQTFRIDGFLEDGNINWSGNIIGVSSFNNNPKLKEWISKLADIYNEVTNYAQKYPNTAVKKKGDL